MKNLFPSATSELLDAAKSRLRLTSDYKLAQALKWNPATISQLRKGTYCMGLIAAAEFAEKTGIQITEIIYAARVDKQQQKNKPINGVSAQNSERI
ncbi:MAG: hypothetical protein M0Q15_03655 [Nevskia sp.]|nr:hypothetical protein [Nevskia sp.]